MTFHLIEYLTLPGDSAKANEDAYGVRDNAAVVFDGATGLGEPLLPGASDAAWIARFGANRLMSRLGEGLGAQSALKAAAVDAERSFAGLRRRPAQEGWEVPYAAMMLCVESAAGFDALWFGDCAALVRRPGEDVFVAGEALDKKGAERAGALRLSEKTGLAPAAGVNRPEFLPALRRARNRLNSEGGSWAFAPDARVADHAGFCRVAAPSGTMVLIASDGFFSLVSEYEAYTLETLMAAAQTRGLAALGEQLRAIERDDAEGWKFPRFKTSDDATALLLRIS